jgi:hypothetical protein
LGALDLRGQHQVYTVTRAGSARGSNISPAEESTFFLLHYFPRLGQATPEQLKDFEWIGRGMAIHWRQLDVDLPVACFLRGWDSRRVIP